MADLDRVLALVASGQLDLDPAKVGAVKAAREEARANVGRAAHRQRLLF